VLSDKSGQVSKCRARSALGGEQLTPLGQGRVAKIFEACSAFEGSVVVEVVMDGGVGGGELL
jgi:hypothetical protein